MDKKNKTLVITLGLTILYLSLMTYFYFDYSNSLDSYNSEVYGSFNTLQNVIHKVHDEDSKLYQILTSRELLSSEIVRNESINMNHTSTIINDLLNIEEDKQFSKDIIVSTIDEYYSLEKIREQIIQLHKLNIISEENQFDSEISDLIVDYEKQIEQILIDIHQEIEFNKEKNAMFILDLKKDFIIKQFILLLVFIFIILLILYNFEVHTNYFNKNLESNQKDEILDTEMQRIISYVKKEVSQGNFPTIKEVKFYLKISHPTLLLKLRELEKKDLISIKKKGRNKYLFIK